MQCSNSRGLLHHQLEEYNIKCSTEEENIGIPIAPKERDSHRLAQICYCNPRYDQQQNDRASSLYMYYDLS